MPGIYMKTLFSPASLDRQEGAGSARSYARMIAAAEGAVDPLGPREIAFISVRDSFYIASVGPTGWPYVQHRGGPPGFLKHLGDNRLGFAEYRGNRQYISAGNIDGDDRVALFLMDYPGRTRLKLIGHARLADAEGAEEAVAAVADPAYPAQVERAMLIDVVGFDWNCPQHITERFTGPEIAAAVAPLKAEIERLRAELAAIRGE
mgnify:CR=1 FL=1